MLKVPKKCKKEGCEITKLWSKGLCKFHFMQENPQKPLKRGKSIPKISAKGEIKKQQKKEYTEKQFELFQIFYDKHQTKRCEQCGVNIPQCLSVNVHHLLPKSIEKYKKIALDDRFWMLLCGNCHSSWENSSKGDKIALRTQEAKIEFNKF